MAGTDRLDAAVIVSKADEIASLRSALKVAITALKPFADCVYNDNGDCTVSDTFSVTPDKFINAHFAEKKCLAVLS